MTSGIGSQLHYHSLSLKRAGAGSLLAAVLILTFSPAQGKPSNDSGLGAEGQQQLSKSLGYLKSGNWSRANEAAELAVSGAPDVSSCLDALAQMERYGAQANKARRACLVKAFNLATTQEELEEVAFKARKAACFDISKQALDSLVGSTTSMPKLYELAGKAQASAMPEIAHIAMEKAYRLVNNQPDALDFMRQAHGIGQDDLARQALKDLIDDQETTTEMMPFLNTIEQYKMTDMVRYLLKAALEKAKNTDEMLAVYDNARKYDQPDIVKVAQFRGRKMVLLKKVVGEDAARKEAEEKKAKEDPNNMPKSEGF